MRFGFLRTLVALASTLPLTGRAELPLARLWTVFPPGAQIEHPTEVTVTGVDVEDGNLVFSHPGISARPADQNASDPQKFVVLVQTNVPVGIYEARLAGRFGISNPRPFVVGTAPERDEKEPHSQFEAAMEIRIGEVINGRTEKGSIDFYKAQLKKGERIFAHAEAARLHSKALPVLIALDQAGNEIDRSRPGDDLSLAVSSDGIYFFDLHDFFFQGGPEYFYRLSVDRGPRVEFILPLAGLPGATGEYHLFGWNLPGGHSSTVYASAGTPLEERAIQITFPSSGVASGEIPWAAQPAAAGLEGFAYRWREDQATGAGVESNPIFLGFASDPVILEREPNNTPETAQRVTVPCEVDGQFYPAGDRDWVQFDAKKGDLFWVEILCDRLGVPSAPFLLIQRVKKTAHGEESMDVKELYDTDTNIGGIEFKMAHHDSAWRLEVPETSTYRIEARDLFNGTSCDPGHGYRLAIRRETPDFHLVALPVAPPKADKKNARVWSSFLRRHDRIPLTVLAIRRDNFQGQIQLKTDGLPAGVRCEGGVIEANSSRGTIILEADPIGSRWAGRIHVIGSAVVKGKNIAHEAEGGELVWNVDDTNRMLVQSARSPEVVVGVSGEETAPLQVELPERDFETSVAGKVEVPIRLVRSGEFNGKVKCTAAGLESLAGFAPVEAADRATNTVLTVDLTKVKLAPGSHCFFIEAETQGKFGRPAKGKGKAGLQDVTVTFYSRPIHLTVRPAPLALQVTGLDQPLRPGSKLELVVKVSRRFRFAGPVELEFKMPPQLSFLSCKKVVLEPGQSEARMILEAANLAPGSIGDQEIPLLAAMKFNQQTVQLIEPIHVKLAVSQKAPPKL